MPLGFEGLPFLLQVIGVQCREPWIVFLLDGRGLVHNIRSETRLVRGVGNLLGTSSPSL